MGIGGVNDLGEVRYMVEMEKDGGVVGEGWCREVEDLVGVGEERE